MSQFRTRTIWVLAIVFLLGVTACGGGEPVEGETGPGEQGESPDASGGTEGSGSEPLATEAVVFPMPFVINGAWTPFFISLDKGYYSDAGFQVAIPRGFGSSDTVKRVQSGSAKFGYADSSAAIRLRAEDPSTDLVTVAQVTQRNPLIAVYVEGQGIESPEDLAGKSYGGPPGSSSIQFYPGYLRSLDINPDDSSYLSMDASAQISALLSGQIDVMTGTLHSFPSMVAAASEEDLDLGYFLFADAGLNIYGWSIITRQATIDNEPELVRRFVRASLQGWADALQDPSAAVESAVKYHPELEPEVAEKELLLKLQLVYSPLVAENTLGWNDSDQWQQTIDNMVEFEGLENPPAAEDMFTNEFLPDDLDVVEPPAPPEL